MRVQSLLITLILLALQGSVSAQNVEKLSAIDGGNFNSVVEFRDTVYTTSFLGSVFFSADGGVSWQKDNRFTFDGAPAFGVVNHAFLVADDVNDQLYLAGKSAINIYSSGTPFTPTTMPDFFGNRGIVGDIVVSDTALYASYWYSPTNPGAIIKSTDKGVTWQTHADVGSFFADLLALPDGRFIGVKGFSFNNSIYISDETLSDFTQLTDPIEHLGLITDIDYTSDGKLVLSSNTNGIFTSEDMGENWTSLTDTNAIEFHELSNGNWLVNSISGNILLSTDQGTTWTTNNMELNSTQFNEQGARSFTELSNGTILGAMIWGDLSNYSFSNTSPGMIRSEDGGSSWSISNEGLSSLATAMMFYDETNHQLYSFIIGTGIVVWNETELSWEVVGNAEGPDLSELQSHINATPGWQAVSEILTAGKNPVTGEIWVITNGVTIKLNTSSMEWEVFEQDPYAFVGPSSLEFFEDGTAYIHETLGIGQGIYTSTDGVNWTILEDSPSGFNISTFAAVDGYLIAHDAYALDGESGILVSKVGETTFTNIHTDRAAYFGVTGMFLDKNTTEIYTTTSALEYGIEKYDLETEEFTDIPFNTDETLTTPSFGGIYRTSNGGTLVEVNDVVNREPTFAGYFYLDADTDKWIKLTSDLLPQKVANEITVKSETELALRFGNEVYAVPLEGVSTSVEEINLQDIPSEFKVLQNYPNPFNPSTILRFQLDKPSHVKLTVYSVNGAEVASTQLGNMSSGYQEVAFNASSLPSGMYIYSIQANGVSKTGRMTLIK